MLLEDYRKERLRKLEEIRAKGIDPYPSKTARNTKIIDVVNHFDEKKGQEVCIAGRIVAIRSFGKLVFLKVRDLSGEVQVFMKATGEEREGLFGAKQIKLLDVGDFIEAKGIVDKTHNGADPVKAEEILRKADKQRASYYNYYATGTWGDVSNYDLCVDTGTLEIEGCVDLICKCVEIKQKQAEEEEKEW